MTTFAHSEIRQYHCRQSRRDSCVAACCAIVECRRGACDLAKLQAFEEGLIVKLDSERWGLDPVLTARELGYRWYPALDIAGRTSYTLLRNLLRDRWIILIVHAGPWVACLNRLNSPPMSEYGPLVKPVYEGEDLTQRALPHHAIVLVGAVRNHFLALDPYHRAERQPFPVSAAALTANIWTGQALVPPGA